MKIEDADMKIIVAAIGKENAELLRDCLFELDGEIGQFVNRARKVIEKFANKGEYATVKDEFEPAFADQVYAALRRVEELTDKMQSMIGPVRKSMKSMPPLQKHVADVIIKSADEACSKSQSGLRLAAVFVQARKQTSKPRKDMPYPKA